MGGGIKGVGVPRVGKREEDRRNGYSVFTLSPKEASALLGAALAVVRSRVPINPAHPRAAFPQQPLAACGCGQFCLQQGGRQVRGESGSQPSGLPTACTPAPQRRERAGVAALTARVVATPGPLAAGRESPHAAASAPGGGGAARASTFPAFPAARGKFTGRRRWPQP